MYQKVRVNARDEKELKMRVEDLEKRGYEVVSYYSQDKEHNSWYDSGYRNADGAKYKHAGSFGWKSFGAVMRREVVLVD